MKKTIEYLDKKDFIERNKNLLFDKGILEALICSLITDKELTKEIISTCKEMDEAWNTGTIKEIRHDKYKNHPAFVAFEQKYQEITNEDGLNKTDLVAKEINKYFESNKKALFILEDHPESLNYLPLLISSDSYNSKVNIKGPIKEPTGCFWKIKKDDKTIGYLLGSIHITPNHLHDLNSRIRKCFEKSTRLAVEIDITRQDIIQGSTEIAMKKQRLSKFSTEQIENICAVLKKVFPENSGKINFNDDLEKKMFILNSVYKLKSRMYTELNLHSGIDDQLIGQAKNANKPVEDLETLAQYQARESSRKPPETDLIDGILQVLTNEELKNEPDVSKTMQFLIEQISLHINESLKPLFDAWEEGKLEQLDHSKTYSVEHKMEMTQRNMNMAMKIVKLVNEPGHDKEKLFCCVGAAHTVGDMNVGAFLSNFGLTIERVLT